MAWIASTAITGTVKINIRSKVANVSIKALNLTLRGFLRYTTIKPMFPMMPNRPKSALKPKMIIKIRNISSCASVATFSPFSEELKI